MTLTFYYAPHSTANITECVLAELGVPCKRVKLDLKKGESTTPEFLAVNPNGKVPTIVHEGTPIWESAAITMYLGEVFGVEKSLYPAPGPKRGEAMKWIVWTNVTLGAAVVRMFTMKPDSDKSEVEKLQKEIDERLKVLDGALEGRPFLLGEDYSLADTHVWSLTGWTVMLGVDLTACPNVGGWLKRCAARPALAKLKE